MSTRVDQIMERVKELTPEELHELEAAFATRRFPDDEWDRQMKADAASGKFDRLFAVADAEIAAGRTLSLDDLL